MAQMFIIQNEGSFTLGKYTEPVPTYPINSGRTEMTTEVFLETSGYGLQGVTTPGTPYIYPA